MHDPHDPFFDGHVPSKSARKSGGSISGAITFIVGLVLVVVALALLYDFGESRYWRGQVETIDQEMRELGSRGKDPERWDSLTDKRREILERHPSVKE